MVDARLAVIVLAGVWTLMSSGCGGQEPVEIPIIDVSWGTDRARPPGTAATQRLRVSVASCGARPQVTVSESGSEVRLLATSENWDPDGPHRACADGVSLALDQPLGNRTVIDAATGREVRVFLTDGIPHRR